MPDRLRVLFVTEDDPLYVIRFFEVFLREYPADTLDVCGITIDRPWHEPIWKTLRRLIGLYGVTGVARLGTRFLRARLSGRSIARLAAERSIPMLPAQSVNAPEYVAEVRRLAPDVIVSVAAPEIFRKDILASAGKRCINIHSGKLPKYRGMMPNFWQLLHGEKFATLTVHEMAEKLDAGDVLHTLEFPLKDRDSLDRVITETKRAGAGLMIEVLRQLREGRDRPRPLDMTQAGYFKFPQPADVKAFRRRGHRML